MDVKGRVYMDMNQGPNYDWMTIWSSLPQQAQQNLVNPPTKAIGDGLGGIFMWVFHKPIEYLAVEQAKVESLKHMTAEKLSKIPKDKMSLDKRGLMIKELEDSKYSLDSDLMREYFSTLIAKTANTDTSNNILPYFSTLLSNLSPKEAKFLLLFKGKNSLIGDYVKNSIALANIKFYDSTMSNHSTYSVDNILLKCDDQNKIKSFSQEIDILKSLGIVQRSIGSFDEQLRDDLEEIKKLSNLPKLKKGLDGRFDINIDHPDETPIFISKHPYSRVFFEYGELRLTNLGKSFISTILL